MSKLTHEQIAFLIREREEMREDFDHELRTVRAMCEGRVAEAYREAARERLMSERLRIRGYSIQKSSDDTELDMDSSADS